MGEAIADSSIVTKMHNRANGGGVQLRECAAINLGVNQSEKDFMFKAMHSGTMRQTRNVKNIKTMAEAMGALGNCEVIWRHLHPMDYGTTALVRFLMDRINHVLPEKRMSNVETVCVFFQAVMKANADRVLGPQYPMTYREVVNFYDSMDWSTSANSLTSSPSKGPSKDWKKSGGVKRPGGELNSARKRENRLEAPLCHDFNLANGCKRSNGEWCLKFGKVYLHQCSRNNPNGGVCGAKDHGSVNHK